MTAQPVRIGIVGMGANAIPRSRRPDWFGAELHHLPKLLAMDGVEVVSLANRTRASAEHVAAEFGIPKVYDDWRSLVAAPDTNAIMIGTWPHTHCEMTLAALAAGKHVLTEARMANDAAEARRMLVASQARPDLVCLVVPSPFTFHIDNAIIAKIREGYLGDLISVQVTAAIQGFADFDGPMTFRHDRDLSGWNTLNLGIWYEGVRRWVGDATCVMARARTIVRQRKDPATGALRDATIPDHVEIIADLACGAVARFSFSAVTGLAPEPQVWIYGTQGTLHYDGGSRVLRGGRRGDTALTPIAIPDEQRDVWRAEEEFVNAIRGLEPVRRTSFADGVRYMEFTEAVGRSAATDQAIRLPLA